MDKLYDNKRLAKNTLFLYLRTMIIMLITLYTSRVVLQVLGTSDFGIYNVIGGLVVMLSFASNAMATATQRFLSYALGEHHDKKIQQIFSLSLLIYFGIAFIIIIIAETIGLYFLTTQMNFPADRWHAVHWVYQFSIISFCLTIVRTPYTASIIAFERMSFYAYISIIENILKLGIVFLLVLFDQDKLILYSILMAMVIAITNSIYYIWCKKKFVSCHYELFWDKTLFRKLLGFSGWSMFGSLAVVGANQGVNIIFNIFVGVIVNAAMGIASQVQTAINSFISGFQTAMSPQIVKLYAAHETKKMIDLVNNASRLSYCLVFLVGMPLLFFCKPILCIWLGNVPEYATVFSQLLIVVTMIDSLSAPLWFSVQATGKVRNYQLLMSSLLFLNLPFAYIMLYYGYPPASVLLIRVIIQIALHSARIVYLGRIMDFPVLLYLRQTMVRVICLTIISLPISFYMVLYSDSLLWYVISFILIEVQNVTIVYFIGFVDKERLFVKNRIKSVFS